MKKHKKNTNAEFNIASELATARITDRPQMAEHARQKILSHSDRAWRFVYYGARAADIDDLPFPSDLVKAVHAANNAGMLVSAIVGEIQELNLQYAFHALDRKSPPNDIAKKIERTLGLDSKPADKLDAMFTRIEDLFKLCKIIDDKKSESGMFNLNVGERLVSLFIPRAETVWRVIDEEISTNPFELRAETVLPLDPALLEEIAAIAKRPASKSKTNPDFEGPRSIN